jgi:hypothetical protein
MNMPRDSQWREGLEHCVSVEFLLQYGDEGVVRSLHISYSQLTQSPDQRYENHHQLYSQIFHSSDQR